MQQPVQQPGSATAPPSVPRAPRAAGAPPRPAPPAAPPVAPLPRAVTGARLRQRGQRSPSTLPLRRRNLRAGEILGLVEDDAKDPDDALDSRDRLALQRDLAEYAVDARMRSWACPIAAASLAGLPQPGCICAPPACSVRLSLVVRRPSRVCPRRRDSLVWVAPAPWQAVLQGSAAGSKSLTLLARSATRAISLRTALFFRGHLDHQAVCRASWRVCEASTRPRTCGARE